MNKIRWGLGLFCLCFPAMVLASQGRDVLQQEIMGLEERLKKARDAQGPMCAPEVLAEAQACLAGVKEEFLEGDYWEAEDALHICKEKSEGLWESILACTEDVDLDGIPDRKDLCPHDPESYNGYKDVDGCPDRMPERALLTAEKIEVLEPIRFEEKSQKPLTASGAVLEDVARILKENPDLHVCIDVHLDNSLPAEVALRVSSERAGNVKNTLEELGIAANRVQAEGKGSREPIASNGSPFGRQLNQRVEFKIIP